MPMEALRRRSRWFLPLRLAALALVAAHAVLAADEASKGRRRAQQEGGASSQMDEPLCARLAALGGLACDATDAEL
eukprot:COSAG06_NODE_23764_length_682_cov_1.142367_1_plen_75_part_01